MNIQTCSKATWLALGLLLGPVVTQSAHATLSIVSLSPSNSAAAVCYDTPLSITFNEPPKLVSNGAIRIYDAANDAVPVDTIDLSLGNLQSRTFPGDSQAFNVYSVLIRGNKATIFPHSGVMASNGTYYVTADPEVFTDAAGTNFSGIMDTNAWRFATRSSGPVDPTNLQVASDGSGDFCTVQGAVDSLPGGNTSPTLISIRDGDYVEIVNISGKNNIVFRGQSREGTLVGYANNANIAPGGTTHARMAFKVNADDIAIDNLTITNRTPQGGSQAEALMLETDVKRFIANNVKLASYQDTILANTSGTQGYLRDSLIQGDVDFIWGGGNLFLTNCEIKSLRSSSAITQPRTAQGSNGMSFVKCRFTRAPSVSSVEFARSLNLSTSSTYGNVVIAQCLIDTHMTGWESFIESPRVQLRWWEYGNSNLTGTAAVQYNGRQIGVTNNDPRLEAALNSTLWLYGWEPELSPNILTQPVNQTVGIGQSTLLQVEATGMPLPGYQWQRFGTNLPGATSATLTLSNAQPADAGSYAVVVSNAAGSVTSAVATVDVVNQPPVPGITTVATPENTPVSLAIAKLLVAASDPQGDDFDISGVSPTSTNGGTVIIAGGVVTYRPPTDYVGADAFTYALTDVPGATTNVTVTVSVTPVDTPGQNQVGEIAMVEGQVHVTFAGIPGRTYSIQRSESLGVPDWVTIGSAVADPQGRVVFVDTTPPVVQAYYRTAYP